MMQYIAKTSTQLGQILKGFRLSGDLTQADVAAKMATQQKAVSTIESSTGSISVDRLFKILAALDLDLVVTPKASASMVTEKW